MSTTYKPGTYQAEIRDQGFTEANTGTPGFFLQLQICGQIDKDGNLLECPRYERPLTYWLKNEINVNILKGALKVLDVEISDLSQLDPENPKSISLVGRKIEVACTIESVNGREMERWNIPRSKKKLTSDAVRALDDQFGHLFRDGNAANAETDVSVPNTADETF